MDTSKPPKLPITITITVSEAEPKPEVAAPRAVTAESLVAAGLQPQAEALAAVTAFRANAGRPYLEEARAEADRNAYYAGVDWALSPADLYRKLSATLRETHTAQPGYRPMVELYPWVDLHPDLKIHSIYSGEVYEAEEFIQMDARVEAERRARLSEVVARAESLASLEQVMAEVEAQLPYNCEHSVPQSWFNKRAPMRGDLHHLFACESGCNSSRGNLPYFEHPDTPGGSNKCGDIGPGGFDPREGKGAVARATLYFLLRYPGVIGDASRELQASRLPLLLQWHRDHPVSRYELHRNQAIFERQGNRNPLIDFPQHADRIDFLAGFGRPAHSQPAAGAELLPAAPESMPTAFRFGEPRPLDLPQAAEAPVAGGAGNEVLMQTLMIAGAEAVAEAQAAFARRRFKPLPRPPGAFPYRMELADILGERSVARIVQAGQFVFHAVGDTGQHGHGAEAQEAVAFHMEQQIRHQAPAHRPALFYHLGDVVYYSGELDQYPEQFYDPYKYYQAPIVAIPGNHDGDNVTGDRSLSAFVRNFCTKTPGVPPRPGDSKRLTMTQPNVYFTLKAPFATIIGLYSNVTGDLDDPGAGVTPQWDWLVGELKQADPGKFLIIAVHHPVYSADNDHGGEKKIGQVLDRAFAAAGRLPHLLLTAHVHDYQRFERKQKLGGLSRNVPYIVAGAGGYAGYDSLHRVHGGVPFPEGVTLVKHNDKLPGFLTLTVTPDRLKGEYFVVPRPPNHATKEHPATAFDSFEIAL